MTNENVETQDSPPQRKIYERISDDVRADFYDAMNRNTNNGLLNSKDQDLAEQLLPVVRNVRSKGASHGSVSRSYFGLREAFEQLGDEKIEETDGTYDRYKITAKCEVGHKDIGVTHYHDFQRYHSEQESLVFEKDGSFALFTMGKIIQQIKDKPSTEGRIELHFRNGDLGYVGTLFPPTPTSLWVLTGINKNLLDQLTEEPTHLENGISVAKIDGKVQVTHEAPGVPVSTVTIPTSIDIEKIKKELFPDEEAIPESEVPRLREELGTHDVPYSWPTILAHPTMARSDFPRDEYSERIIDLDEGWRNADLPNIVGVKFTTDKPTSNVEEKIEPVTPVQTQPKNVKRSIFRFFRPRK